MAKKPQAGAKGGAGKPQLAHNQPASPETGVKGDPTTSVMMADPRQPGKRPKATFRDAAGVTAEVDGQGSNVRTKTGLGDNNVNRKGALSDQEADSLEEELLEDGGAGADQGDGGDAGGDDVDGEPAESDDTEAEALPEYDPEDQAVVAAYEERYLQEDGTPNLDAISAEWFATAKGDMTKGGLSEGTYGFLENRYGLTREQIKELEAGQVARQSAQAGNVYERAGGKERLDAAVKWGTTGGYTPAQRQRFNAAMNSGDPEAVADAVDALMARYEKGNPGQARRPAPGAVQQGRRPASPQKDATARAAPARLQGYANYHEYQQASRTARAAGDMQALEQTRRRLRASDWFRNK